MGARLVRDRALDNWVVPGAEHQVRPVRDLEEHSNLLVQKLLEEVAEVITSQDNRELTKEIADVLTVLEAIAHLAGVSWKDVTEAVDRRIGQSGGFVMGLVWETGR